MRKTLLGSLLLSLSIPAAAVEQTVQNDSLTDFGTAVIVTGFVAGEKAAVWLESPCDGVLVATQVFWRSQSGSSGETIHSAIEIYDEGTFPNPGGLLEVIGGPVLNDGVLNEYRFLDENNTVPLQVPVTQGRDFVLALVFDTAPPGGTGPSVVRDANGIVASRNTIFATPPGAWFPSEALGLSGDFVIRGVVDCGAVAASADIEVSQFALPAQYTAGEPLGLSLTVTNNGPDASPSISLVDVFPPQLDAVAWTCSGSGGAVCPADGSGNLLQGVSLPNGGTLEFAVSSTVIVGTTGNITNSWSAVAGGSVTDPDLTNNTSTLVVEPAPEDDSIFVDGFDPTP